MSSKFQVFAAVYLILINDKNQVLLSKRFNTGFMDGFYGLPSGHLEANENLTEALVRESKEEIGIIPLDYTFVRVNHRKASTENQRDYVDFYFQATKYEGQIQNLELDKCSELEWFDLNNLPVNTMLYIQNVLENLEAKEFFAEI